MLLPETQMGSTIHLGYAGAAITRLRAFALQRQARFDVDDINACFDAFTSARVCDAAALLLIRRLICHATPARYDTCRYVATKRMIYVLRYMTYVYGVTARHDIATHYVIFARGVVAAAISPLLASCHAIAP